MKPGHLPVHPLVDGVDRGSFTIGPMRVADPEFVGLDIAFLEQHFAMPVVR